MVQKEAQITATHSDVQLSDTVNTCSKEYVSLGF